MGAGAAGGYQLLLARQPTSGELSAGVAALATGSDRDLAVALALTPEYALRAISRAVEL